MAFTSGPLYLNVFTYGAKGDGVTDDTAAIQNAINAAFTIRSSGAQNKVIVSLPPAQYLCTGTLDLWNASGSTYQDVPVILAGASRGPYSLGNRPTGGWFDIPLLLITNRTSPFIRVGKSTLGYQMQNVSIEDLHFHYPTNETPSNTPTLFPPTISIVSSTAVAVRRCSSDNATQFITTGYDQVTGAYSLVGRCLFEDLFIAAFLRGISVDTALDVVRIQNVHVWPFWDHGVPGATTPTKYDYYAFNHSVAFALYRADGVMMSNCFVFGSYVGIFATKSANPSPPSGTGLSYCQVTNFDADNCWAGIWASETKEAGVQVTNFIAIPSERKYHTVNMYSAWAAYAGNGFAGTNGAVQVVGGWVNQSAWQAVGNTQTLRPYSVISTKTITGPFGQNGTTSSMRAVWIDGYD